MKVGVAALLSLVQPRQNSAEGVAGFAGQAARTGLEAASHEAAVQLGKSASGHAGCDI